MIAGTCQSSRRWFAVAVLLAAGLFLVGPAPGARAALNLPSTAGVTPVVNSISPTSGPAGTTVTITGTGFTGLTGVTFAGVAATNSVFVSDTSVTATAPPGTGTVDVQVTTDGGTSAISQPNDQFTYPQPPPTVLAVAPNAGPTTGGTLVTITGTNFTTTSTVMFGNVPATNVTMTAAGTQLTVTSPAASAGMVDVIVTTGGLPSSPAPADQFTYDALPSVTGVSPNYGATGGGTPVTISGTGFTGATSVTFGGVPAPIASVSATSITATAPAATAPGTVDVQVTTPGGPSPVAQADEYAYEQMPMVTGISPASGPVLGGTAVTITGTGFNQPPGHAAATVAIGTLQATNVSVNGAGTQITATVPEAATTTAVSTVDIVVTNVVGPSATGAADQYTYTFPTPAVSRVEPLSGPVGGGNTVTISGTGFTGVSAVTFAGLPATSFTFVSDSQINAVVPRSSASGSVDVVVTTPGGQSETGQTDDTYYYQYAQPTVSGVTPADGPIAGGTTVTITGTNFTGANVVYFGAGNKAASFAIVSDTQITAVAPPAASSGFVGISVVAPGGTSPTNASDLYDYIYPQPKINGVNPSGGSLAGGGTVTITGSGFTGATKITFGGVTAANLVVQSDTQLSATAPASSTPQSVDVAVTTPGGTSPSGPGDRYEYGFIKPQVTGVSPTSGPVGGGTAVMITGSAFTQASSVTFGGLQAMDLKVVSDGVITVVTPPYTKAAPVSIVVTTPGGAASSSQTFNYQYAVPQVTNVTPPSGPLTGGGKVTISGSGFTGASSVGFIGVGSASYSVVSDTSIVATVPASQSSGPVAVVVTGPNGHSGTSGSADVFTYLPVPAVTAVSPSSGPLAGGTAVTIKGTGFTSASAVQFGSTPAKFTVASDGSITATAPAVSNAGGVDVTVVTPGGTSVTGADDVFTYSNGTSTATTTTPAPTPAAKPLPVVQVVQVGSRGTALAVVSASVNPGGQPITGCAFEFGTSSRYGHTVPCTAPAGTSTSPVSITSKLTGLSPYTTYHVRLQITTTGGSGASPDSTFATKQLPLLGAPLVGLLLQPTQGRVIGHLLGVQGVQGAHKGERLVLSCAHSCVKKTLLTVAKLKPPYAKIQVRLARAVSLLPTTRISILVTLKGEVGRYATYAFARKGTGVNVRVVQTGCIATSGRNVSCRSLGLSG